MKPEGQRLLEERFADLLGRLRQLHRDARELMHFSDDHGERALIDGAFCSLRRGLRSFGTYQLLLDLPAGKPRDHGPR